VRFLGTSLLGLGLALLIAAAPPPPPIFPVVISTDKDAYYGQEHIVVTLHNRAEKGVWVAPFLKMDRGRGDGSFEPVYRLRVVNQCAPEPPPKTPCVLLKRGEKLTLPSWDWNTGGTDQCPPRRPGHRAFKGVHRIIAESCPSKPRQVFSPRIKFVTWE
jgi:hypothetical protein